MAIKDQIKSVIVTYGTTTTITPITTSTDSRGDQSEVAGSDVITKGVMDGFLSQQLNLQKQGDFPDNEAVLYLSYDETINKGDRVTYQSKIHDVLEVEPYYLSDELVAIQCVVRLKE